MDLLPPTMPELIKEAERELSLRKRVYPQWVKTGRLKQDKADRQIELMEHIVVTLAEVERLRVAAKEAGDD